MEGTKMFDLLFGKNKDQYASEYDTAIKNAKQDRADAAYNYRYNKALYDANKDYFDKMGVKDPSASYWNDTGQRTNDYTETMNQYGKYLNDLNKEKEDVAWKNRYNIFGDGLVGSLLNPFHQAGTAVQDFASSGTKEWDNGNRDVLSDLGAMGESALIAAPFVGAGAKVLRGGSAVANGINTASKLGKVGSAMKSFTTAHPALAKVGKSALGMGGWSALDAVNEYGSDIENHIPETALKVGIGTTLGAATGGIGYGVDKLANRAKVTRDLSDLYQQYLKQQNGSAITDSSKLLGDGMGGATSVVSPAPRTATEEWLMNRGNLAKTKLGQAIQGVGDTVSYRNLTGNSVTNKLGNLANKVKGSKVGTNVANLLKTKKGKVLLGGSAGLTLAGLMKNRNDNNTGQLSDEEMQELYNYVYGGGQ